ncbi:MAG: hypothetical protein Q4G07_00990 [Oscillospiraceae bacterium]|nr:hypothetical protein [Oscillospiraceae bacterium]
MNWFYAEFLDGLSVYTLLWYFILYSVLGWLAEVAYCTLGTGKLVNRGFLNGPVCPVYGFGMTLLLLSLHPVMGSVPLVFLGSALLASAVEWIAGWLLEKLFHTRLWNYSDKPFNLGGYICLLYSCMWGLGGLFMLRLIHPGIAWLIALPGRTVGTVLLLLALAALFADVLVTVLSMLKLGRTLTDLEKASALLRAGSDAVSGQMGEALLSLRKKYGKDFDQAKRKLAKAEAALSQKQALDRQKLSELRERLMTRAEKKSRRLEKAFPQTRHLLHGDLWDELKDKRRK